MLAHEYDVCVFGAGPAALSVVARLLDLGRDVAVLDRPLRAKPWGGESFTSAIRGPLVALGFWDGFAKAGHLRGYERQIAWGGEPRCESSLFQPSGPMWHVDRDRFDDDLRNAVRHRADIFRPYRKLDAIARGSGIWRLVLDGGTELSARYLVDGTGRSRALAKRLGARIVSHDRLIGLAAKVSGNDATFYVPSLIIQAMPFGWWYAAPVPGGHVAVLFTDAELAPSDVRRRLRPVAANSALTHAAGEEGWLAVGDASASYDPLCGWGVHRALTDGVLAADAIDDYLRTGSPSSLMDYCRQCQRQFGQYLEGLTRNYSMERRWASAPFWERRLGSPRTGGEL